MEDFQKLNRLETLQGGLPSRDPSQQQLYLNPEYSKIISMGHNWILQTGSLSNQYKINPEKIKISISNRKLVPIWRRVRVKLFMIYSLTSIARQLHLYGGDIDVLRRNSIPNIKSIWSQKNPGKKNMIRRVKTKIQPIYPRCVLNPQGFFKQFWNILLIFLLLYTGIFMPYLLAFENIQSWNVWFVLDLVTDALFAFDILVNFCTPFQDESGKMVVNQKKIALNYLKTWFFCDLIASFPLNLFLQYTYFMSHYGMSGNFNNLLRVLRIPRLFRLIRLQKLCQFPKSKQTQLAFKVKSCLSLPQSRIRLLKSLGSILLLVHIFACFWYYIARIEDFNVDSWVSRKNLRNQDKFTLYITSVYWTITTLTTVGFGDITPKSQLQLQFSIILMIVGMYVISFTIGSLASMLSQIDTKDRLLFNKLSTIQQFSREAKLKKSLFKKIKQAIQYNDKRTGFTQKDLNMILSELSSSLKYKVAIAMHRGQIDKLTFFVNKGEVFIGEIVPFLLPQFYTVDECVYQIRDFAIEIYFILKGRVNYEYKGSHPMIVQSISGGNYFGDIQVIKGVPRIFSAVIESNCHLLVMNRELVQKIKVNFNTIWKELEEIADRREQKIDQVIQKIYQYKHWKGKDYDPKSMGENSDWIQMKQRERIRKRMFGVVEHQEEFEGDWEIYQKLDTIIKQLTLIDSHIQTLSPKKSENLKASIQ